MTELTKNKKPGCAEWVFVLKKDENESIVRHKIRGVAKGYSEICGVSNHPRNQIHHCKIFISVGCRRRYGD